MTTQIFARALPAAVDGPETIAEIVARVRQPSALRTALENYRQLQQQHTELYDELRASIAQLQGQGGEASTGAAPLVAGIVALDRRVRALAAKIPSALDAILAARPPYTAAVAAALAPHRKTAAKAALLAAVTLVGQLGVLAQIDTEARAAGETVARALPGHRSALRPLIVRLCRLAGERVENYDNDA